MRLGLVRVLLGRLLLGVTLLPSLLAAASATLAMGRPVAAANTARSAVEGVRGSDAAAASCAAEGGGSWASDSRLWLLLSVDRMSARKSRLAAWSAASCCC